MIVLEKLQLVATVGIKCECGAWNYWVKRKTLDEKAVPKNYLVCPICNIVVHINILYVNQYSYTPDTPAENQQA